jgi:hypothetical protein
LVGFVCGAVTSVPVWAVPPSADITAVADAALQTRDSGGTPFAVVDKRNAQLAVYDMHGRLVGVAPALLGLMPGDQVFEGAASKVARGGLPPSERTTPAGRYMSTPGANLSGERVVWVDYANALAIHRLRPAPPQERRPERLATPSPDDNRITLGCVVVDPAFFDNVVLPLLGHSPGVVYILRDDVTEP